MLPPDAKRPDSVEGVNLLVIHPNSQWKTVFDLLVATCILYTAVVAPVQVCFVLFCYQSTLSTQTDTLPGDAPCHLVITRVT